MILSRILKETRGTTPMTLGENANILLNFLSLLAFYILASVPTHFYRALHKIRELQDYYDYMEYKTLNSMVENIVKESLNPEEIKLIERNIHEQYSKLRIEFIFYRYITKQILGLKTFPKDLYSAKLRLSELIPEEIPKASKYLAQQQIMKYNTYLGYISARQPEDFERIIRSINEAEEELLRL